MLTAAQKKVLNRIHDQTSDSVRDWITERIHACQRGNPWAEQQLKLFIREFNRLGSGVRAYMWLVGEHEQLKLVDETPESDTPRRVADPPEVTGQLFALRGTVPKPG